MMADLASDIDKDGRAKVDVPRDNQMDEVKGLASANLKESGG